MRPALTFARAAALVGSLGVAWLAACRERTPETEQRSPVLPAALEARTGGLAEPSHPRAAEPFANLSRCRVDHGGAFLDLGSETSSARRSFALGPFNDVSIDAWGGQYYTRFSSRQVDYDLWLPEARAGLELRVRARAGSAGRLSASVDQQRLGTLRLRGAGFQTLSFAASDVSLAPGRHLLRLRWSGQGAGDARAFGAAEWIHWAEPGQPAAGYRAPRDRSLWADVLLDGAPRRSVVIEAPGSLSCPVQLEHGTALQLGLGYWGEGSGVARVLLRRDGQAPQVLLERRINGAASGARWLDVNLELDEFGSQFVHLELQAAGEDSAGRVAFSEPRILRAPSPARSARARLAVLVIASGLHRDLLPPFAGTRQLRHLTRLAEASVRFPEYQVPTNVVSSVVASLLSGLPPPAHGLESPKARLPDSVQILSQRIHEMSGESAFFTGVPQTRAVFGFDRGWNRYEAFSPVHDIPAIEPLTRARAWLEAVLDRDPDAARLLVLHVRGGHPPWDLAQTEVSELEPREYTGLLEARRGGIILAQLRKAPRPAQRRLAPVDWVRLHAFELAALARQDAALGELLELLERRGIWDQTLFVFTGDIAPGDPPEVPYGEARSLGLDRLLVPLWIKFPGARAAGSVVPGAVTSTDVTRTLANALGVRLAEQLGGVDLGRRAAGDGPATGAPVLATLGPEYATRWGSWLLSGRAPKVPRLCDLSADPACAHDLLEQKPLAAEALWRATFEEQRRQPALDGALRRPELAPIDRDTAAALQVWGD